MIFLETDGIKLEGFNDVSVRRAFDEMSGAFNFTTTILGASKLPVERRSEVSVFIDDEKILSGFVDSINLGYAPNTHSIGIAGRSKTSVLIDSPIPTNRTFNAPINLQKITENIIAQLGSDIKVTNKVSDLKNFNKNQVAEIDETAFMFLEKLARKSSVVLSTDPDGNVVISRAGTEKIDTKLLNEIDGKNNNIKDGTVMFDDSQRFYKYNVFAQQVDEEDFDNDTEATVQATATDSEALLSKQLNILLETEGSIQDAQDRANWEANIRRAKSAILRYSVNGFSHKDGLWTPNQLVRVVDDFARIDSDMLIRSVEFRYSEVEGSLTLLELMSQDAYTPRPEPTTAQKQTGFFG